MAGCKQGYNKIMISQTRANPYHADFGDDVALAPFAGRQDAFGRLYQQFNDPARRRALVFVGRRRIGKTALLHACDHAFSETFVGALVALRAAPPASETELVLSMAQAATAALIERDFTLSRLSDMPPPDDDPRGWFAETFLPQVLAAIRAYRQLTFMLDDVDRLAHSARTGAVGEDIFTYLHDLLSGFPQLGYLLTIDSEFETDLPALAPLVQIGDEHRLRNLSADEVRWLLQEPVRGRYTVPDQVCSAVYRATGGAPALVQQFGFQLFQRWQGAPELNVVTLEDIKALTPAVFKYAENDHRYLWSQLTFNERLVLTAISSLQYDDPLNPVEPDTIASWLIETDYPLDSTSINAALRSLEYREAIALAGGGLALKAGLLQSWLLDNARLARQPNAPRPPLAFTVEDDLPPRRPPLGPMLAIGTVLGIILALIILAVINSQSVEEILEVPAVQPTVTLVAEELPEGAP